MWEAIAYVSSGFTLAAFLAAVVAWSFKAKVDERERLIRTAKPEERADLVRNTLEFFHVDATKLTKDLQYKVVLEQIHARSQRFRMVSVVICFLAAIAAVVAIYAMTERTAPQTTAGAIGGSSEPRSPQSAATRKPEPAIMKLQVSGQQQKVSTKGKMFNVVVFRVENETDETVRDVNIEVIPGEWPTHPLPKRDDNSLFLSSSRCRSISHREEHIWKINCDYIGSGGVVGFAVATDEKDGYPAGNVVLVNADGTKRQPF